MVFELTERQRILLVRVVDSTLRELRVEVRHTRDSDQKAYLKRKESTLRQIQDKLAVMTPAVVNI